MYKKLSTRYVTQCTNRRGKKSNSFHSLMGRYYYRLFPSFIYISSSYETNKQTQKKSMKFFPVLPSHCNKRNHKFSIVLRFLTRKCNRNKKERTDELWMLLQWCLMLLYDIIFFYSSAITPNCRSLSPRIDIEYMNHSFKHRCRMFNNIIVLYVQRTFYKNFSLVFFFLLSIFISAFIFQGS